MFGPGKGENFFVYFYTLETHSVLWSSQEAEENKILQHAMSCLLDHFRILLYNAQWLGLIFGGFGFV